MVKSTRKGKMSKKRAGTRKIKGGARLPHVSSPTKFSFGSFVSSFTPKPASLISVDHSTINFKKRHAGGMSCGTKKHDKKSKKGGKKHGGMAVPMPGGTKKSKKHGMSCGTKKSKKHGGDGPKEGTRAWAASLPKSMRAAYEPSFNPWTGGKKSKKGGRSKYYNSLPSTSSLQSHFPYGINSYYLSK